MTEQKLGRYTLLKEVGKGGMGEVYLAYDPACRRQVALKKIRPDLANAETLYKRFLREAQLTAQLTHPAIIPIYTIHRDKELLYYTMPFVDGESLKAILRARRVEDREGLPLHPMGSSIPALVRIFAALCQAIAYAHSKQVLHCDLKPDNVMVGRYGEVIILDWGLAKPMDEELPTAPLKAAGTLSYMAPEIALGQPPTVLTEIYSLGATLYQILTLRHPFRRASLKKFKERLASGNQEEVVDPAQVAPYRDVPKMLARIASRCLAFDPRERYQSVDELIKDLDSYIEGRAEWFPLAQLAIDNREDWEFQENVLLTEHVALTRAVEGTEWVGIMISKASFAQNIRVDLEIKLEAHSRGIGLLLNVPEAANRVHPTDGLCLWLGRDSSRLFRSGVEVMELPDVSLKPLQWIHLRVERLDKALHVYLDGVEQFSYITYLPVVGTHVGLLYRDLHHEMRSIKVSVGGLNVTVNCLAVPDAFLALKLYDQAISEYRRIGDSFPGRLEGREGMFRAGVTLLEQARLAESRQERDAFYSSALEEFEKLRGTSGAPLEYLGKALTYYAVGDTEEEIKCLELAFRKYKHHPLLSILQERAIYRMHESSQRERIAAYRLVFLVVRQLSPALLSSHAQRLIQRLKENWEPLPFVLTKQDSGRLQLATQLGFWLAQPFAIAELIQEAYCQEESSLPLSTVSDAIFLLIELGAYDLAQEELAKLRASPLALYDGERQILAMLDLALKCHTGLVTLEDVQFPSSINKSQARALLHIAEWALHHDKESLLLALHTHFRNLPSEEQILLDAYTIWAYLLQNDWTAAEILFRSPLIHQENSPFHMLYGCYLAATQGANASCAHFTHLLAPPYPRSWSLLSHFHHQIPAAWLAQAFLWEKRQLYRQLALYAHCLGDQSQAALYQTLASSFLAK